VAAPELLLWQKIPTVISASRREEPASRAPQAVSIITADQIHESGLMTLGELLRLAVGVDVAQQDGGSHAIGVRGMHGKWSNSTLVLMDGRTIYNPIWGGVLWGAQPILLEDIERIEVVRGPGGAAWGANAANGVINIITKKPADTPGFFLGQTLSSRPDSLTHMRYGFTAGNLDLRLSAGYDHLPEIGTQFGSDNHDFVRMPRVNLRSTYHLDKERSLDVDAGYVDGVFGSVSEPILLSGATFEDARWFPQGHFVRLRYTQQKAPDDSWYVQYFLNRETLDESDGGLWLRYMQHDVEVQRVQRIAGRHVLTYGGNVRVDELDNGDAFLGAGIQGIRLDGERTYNRQAGLFLQDKIEAGDDWTFIAGARGDHNTYTGWEWSGRGTALYHPLPEHTFRLSVARAFRTPTLAERAMRGQFGPTGIPFFPFGAYVYGNEDVNASYIKAYEAGYTYEKKPVRLNAEFFWNDYRGLVLPPPMYGPGVLPVVWLYRNQLGGDLYGYELSGEWQATRQLRLDANYVWEMWVQSTAETWYTPNLAWANVAIPPMQKVGVGARYELLKDLILNGRMWWVDEAQHLEKVPPWTRFDFTVIKKFGKRFELAAGVQNAFESRHPEMTMFGEVPVEVGERTWFVRFQTSF